jgi:hypothetical protein
MMLSRWASRELGGSSFGDKLFTLRIGMAQRLFLSWTRVGSTHFLMKTLPHENTEMSLHVLAYNLKRMIAILGISQTKAIRLLGA